jgi:hypothetical protein
MSGTALYELEFFHSKPTEWCSRISKKFGLNEIEQTVLSSYLHHIHPDGLEGFAMKLMSSPRSYLDPFVDNDLEEFGEDMFRVDHEDLFDPSPSGIRGRMVLYNTFVDNLKEMTKEDREIQYERLGIVFSKGENKPARRIKLYNSFIEALRGMSKEEFASYQGIF